MEGLAEECAVRTVCRVSGDCRWRLSVETVGGDCR